MIFLSIRNLNKIYNENTKKECHALKDINLEFHDKGLIFVIGKSGSGKSTLLNIVGGLDSLTSGDIIYKDVPYSEFNTTDFDDLRKNEMGFIFQDFCLIDDLTVFDNIKSQTILFGNEIKDEEIIKMIEDVGLSGFENKLCKELSAGQRQRVAIARAMIKKPSILLCDEPTGNLDYQTSKQILELIRKFSSKTLVLLISHNIDDAYYYADRIIELSEGNVISNKYLPTEYRNKTVINKTVFLNNINTVDLDEINKNIIEGKIEKLDKKSNLFIDYKDRENLNYYEFRKCKSLRLEDSFKFSNKLFSKQHGKTIVISIINALIIAIFAISLMFIRYDEKKSLSQMLEQSDLSGEAVNKKAINSYLNFYTDEEIDNLKNSSYEGEFSYLLNVSTFYTNKSLIDYDRQLVYNRQDITAFNNIITSNLYLNSSMGTLVTNENYIKKTFDKFELLAEAEYKDYGVYITDFYADQYLGYSNINKEYSELVGKFDYPMLSYNANLYYINGIIKTNYQKKFKDILPKIAEARANRDKYNELKKNKSFVEFLRYASYYYCISYTINPNFREDLIKWHNKQCYLTNSTLTIKLDNTNIELSKNNTYYSIYCIDKEWEDDNALYIPIKTLNDYTDNNYTYEEWDNLLNNRKINIDKYDLNNEILHSKQFNVYPSENNSVYASKNAYEALLDMSINVYQIYLDNSYDLTDAYKIIVKEGYSTNTLNSQYAINMTSVINVYMDVFKLLLVVSLVGALLILIFEAYNSVKRFTYEIGILKALGAKTKNLISIFMVQYIYNLILSIIFSLSFIFLLTMITNNVLIKGFNLLYRSGGTYNIKVLFLNPFVLLIVLLMIIVLMLLATLFPIIKLRKIKPINIIKAKY